MDEVSPDIVKYQKLAAEYSKMRAQVTVLKKAIAEEQDKHNELKEILKDKDQSIRKFEQEIECLNFRNLQLIKRITVLQNDLENVEDERIKKGKSKVPTSSFPATSDAQLVFNTELLSRIEENEKLHQKVFESESQYKKVISEMSVKIEQLESQLKEQQSSLNATIKRQEETISKLSQERAKFELMLKNYEKDIKDVKSKDEICTQQLDFIKKDLGSKLEESNQIIHEKIYFNDTKWKNLNSLNAPILMQQKQKRLVKLILELKSVVCDLVKRLSDLHTYMAQKLQYLNLPKDETSPVNKLTGYLRENATYLRLVEETYEKFSEKILKDSCAWFDITSLKAISISFSKYVRYLDKLLPYLLLCIQNEDNCKGTTARLKEIYAKFQVLSQTLTVSFSKLEKYVELIIDVGSPTKSSSYNMNRQILVQKIIESLSHIQAQFDSTRSVFGAKVMIDNDLPITTDDARTTDDCILSCMVSISTGLKKMISLLEDHSCVLDYGVPFQPRGMGSQKKLDISLCALEQRKRGLQYMSCLTSDETIAIPHEIALKNNDMLKNYADSRESLSSQLQVCQSKVVKLELEKEHWMVECQLLKTRQPKWNIDAVHKEAEHFPESDEPVQEFVKSSVNQLVTQIQFADSKSLAFQNECECLYQKLKLIEQRHESSEKEKNMAKETVERLQEEHRSMIKNYDDQLNMMSEHLATMNETLTLQKDEIDALKHSGSNKGAKRNKGK